MDKDSLLLNHKATVFGALWQRLPAMKVNFVIIQSTEKTDFYYLGSRLILSSIMSICIRPLPKRVRASKMNSELFERLDNRGNVNIFSIGIQPEIKVLQF